MKTKTENAGKKMPNSAEGLLDVTSLFGAYWTSGDSSTPHTSSLTAAGNAPTSNIFAAAAAAGVYHPLMGSIAMLPPTLAAAAVAASPSSTASNSNGGQITNSTSGPLANSNSNTLASSAYSISSSSGNTNTALTASSSASSTNAYNNAYTNTLAAAASQAASLQGMSAWWSMAQQFAAHDYVTRMQANALNIPAGFMGNPSTLSDPYAAVAALGLSTTCTGSGGVSSHKLRGAVSSKSGSSKNRNSGKNQYNARRRERDRDKYSSHAIMDHKKSIRELDLISAHGINFKDSSKLSNRYAAKEADNYSSMLASSSSGNMILEKELALANHHLQVAQDGLYEYRKSDKQGDRGQANAIILAAVSAAAASSAAASISYDTMSTSVTSSLPKSILSDPHTILGGVRLPPDTEIIKYTSSIVGPKIPGTTNRGRKKTISLDHGSSPGLSTLMLQQHHSYQQPTLTTANTTAANNTTVGDGGIISGSGLMSVQPTVAHAASGGGSSLSLNHVNMLADTRNPKRPKLDTLVGDHNSLSTDHVEVIKLPTKNGSATSMSSYNFSASSGCGNIEAPLNLSLKSPSSNSHHHTSSSLSSLSNMSANIGLDRISRRKPGPKPRRVPPTTPPLLPAQQTTNTPLSTSLPPGAPSASLAQLFATAAAAAAVSNALSPGNADDALYRPSSRCDIGGAGGSNDAELNAISNACNVSISGGIGNKDSRPRNLGRGVSKPKKNTVASLLAQSRALDPSASMSQQMSLLKSNILAAQQYIAEVGGDEKTLNKFLQDKFRGALSDSSTVDASTDSDNLTDSNQTDSEMESSEVQSMRRSKQYDETALRIPLERGWKRETIIRGITKNGAIRGDVIYIAPESNNKFKQMSDITQYLDYQKSKELSKENFTFSCRVILGDYIHMMAPEYNNDNECTRMSEEDVIQRLDDLRASMRTSIPVEQRIEVARRQQAVRVAARLDREQARLTRELERSERQEAVRRDKEAKRKKQEDIERQKQEEQQRKQQEREMKRHQNAIIKEQMYIQEVKKQRELLYTVELERERRKQHMALVKALENRCKLEDRERKKQQVLAEKQANKEKKIEQRRIEMDILNDIRKPCEDLELEHKPLPEFERIPGLKLPGKAFGDILMVYEFLHNFGETLGFDMESLPSLDALQQALLVDEGSNEAEEELLNVLTHLIVCAIEDPGIPNPARHTTLLGQSLRSADITHANLSEILRIYLYANATGEVKTLTGVSFERDREKRVADHHQTDSEMQSTQGGKNSTYYEKLHTNATWKMADMLKDRPFMSLSSTNKAAILSFICNELLQNKAVIRQIDNSMETVALARKEKWILDAKARKLKILFNKKIRTETVEKVNQMKIDGAADEIGSIESPVLHKEDLLEDDETEMNMSENESVGTQPEEEEDAKLSVEELGKKMEKAIKSVNDKLNSINATNYQMRATCYGQDRFFRTYWSLSKAGGIFIEAMESVEPSELILQMQEEQLRALFVKSLDNIEDINTELDEMDINADNEVSEIIGNTDIIRNKSYSDCTIKEYINDGGDEHSKTINRIENGEIDHKLSRLQQNVDAVENKFDPYEAEIIMEAANDSEIISRSDINISGVKGLPDISPVKINDIETEPEDDKEFQMSDELYECIDSKTIQDINTEELEEEFKWHVLSDIKAESSADSETTENNDQYEFKWFSILYKEGSCEGIQLCSGNKWDNAVGIFTRDNVTELKIPVFPPPGSNATYTANTCESPAPLQVTPEEMTQMEYIKEHGQPKPVEKSLVSVDKRYGWWRLLHVDTLKEFLNNLHIRGARERELKRTIISVMQNMYEQANKLYIEPGNSDGTVLCGYNLNSNCQPKKESEDLQHIDEFDKRNSSEKHTSFFQIPSYIQTIPSIPNVPIPDSHDAWFAHVAERVDRTLLEQVEALEDKVANASMQMKGWKLPHKETEIPVAQLVQTSKERLTSLEAAIERRYLKPPLGVILSDPNLVAIAQEAAAAASIITATCITTTFSATGNTPITNTGSSPGNSQCGSYHNQVTFLNSIPFAALTTTSAPILRSASPHHHLHVELTPSGGNLFSATPVLPNNNNGLSSAATALAQLDEVPKALTVWRDSVNRAQTSAQLSMCLQTLEASIAWDKSIMKANCQFCNSGDNEDKLLLCDSCDKGYHTYCFKPKIDTIPDGDWYCHECMNKARGEKNCIVCGKKVSNTCTKLMACELCPRAYHTDCIRPNMGKVPRGKWYCTNCISKKPQKKITKKNCVKRDAISNNESSDQLQAPASPALSHSSATTNEDISVIPPYFCTHRSPSPLNIAVSSGNTLMNSLRTTLSCTPTPVSNAIDNTVPRSTTSVCIIQPPQQQYRESSSKLTSIPATISSVRTSPHNSVVNISDSTITTPEAAIINSNSDVTTFSASANSNTSSTIQSVPSTILNSTRKDKAAKKISKELTPCKAILADLECHDDAWPFLLPVNTKHFPTYKKIIKIPIDLSTIKKRLHDGTYKTKEDFSTDVRQMFNNCETFNEDDSPVGKAGHCMRQFFESRWNEHFLHSSHS